LGHDTDQPLRADDETEPIVMTAVEMLAAEPDDVALGRHELDAEHVVRGEAVLQAVHSARVLGDVAPDRARDLARRIRRIVKTLIGHRMGDREICDAALRDDAAVRIVYVEYPVELAERDDDRVRRRYRSPGQRRARTARHDPQAFFVREAQDCGDLSGRAR